MKRIDLIIDALEKAKDGWQCFDEYEKALAAARELKALEPVGVCVEPTRYSLNEVDWYSYTPGVGTKLYALDGEQA